MVNPYMTGIKEYTCWEEHEVMYGIVGLLYCTPETNNTVCQLAGIKIKTKNLMCTT